jgi:hypothetical protein
MGIMVQEQARQKVTETSFQQTSPVVMIYVCNPSHAVGVCRRITILWLERETPSILLW